MNNAERRLALAAAATTAILVGATFVATRFVATQIEPASLAFLRYFIALLFLGPFAYFSGALSIRRDDIVPVVILGVFQFAVVIILLNFSLLHLPASRSALLFAQLPLLTMVIAALMGRERLTMVKSLGVILTVIGVSITLGERLVEGAVPSEWIGAAAALAAAVFGAGCSVLFRPYLQRNSTVAVGTLSMLASVLFLAAPAGMEGFFAGLPNFDPLVWANIVFIGLASSTGFVMWLWSLKIVGPTNVSVFFALSPVTAALLGVALLGEAYSVSGFIGLVTVVTGIWVAVR